MVASACASAGVSGPTTRSVAGADAGDADVAGGGGGMPSPPHAFSPMTAAATRPATPSRFVYMGVLTRPSALLSACCSCLAPPQRGGDQLLHGYDIRGHASCGEMKDSSRKAWQPRYAFFSGVFLIGSSRTRMPVAAWIALASAAASGGTPGSPSPPSGASDRMNAVVTFGASAM
jgi:hypothetical protein